ncbi:D-alanyl-D-alanine carboxypeptidase, partial [Robertmurraya sp. DFI.2.37]|nr:D-alanyl-D-alanine carboxypeptidase [Robertmurraya sp. DFI.2.37]
QENFETLVELDKEKLNEDGSLTAPIKKGDKLGTVKVQFKDEETVYLSSEGQRSMTVDLVAAEDVEKANWFVLMMRGIGAFFGDLWSSVSSTVKGW